MVKMSAENRKLHAEWRAKVLERDGYRCVACKPEAWNEGQRLNAHHLIPKEFKEYRWDVDNGMTLCVHHHTLGKFSAHKNPVWFTLWLKEMKTEVFITICKRFQRLV